VWLERAIVGCFFGHRDATVAGRYAFVRCSLLAVNNVHVNEKKIITVCTGCLKLTSFIIQGG